MELKKAVETRKKILEKAFELFLQKGYHGTSMSELVSNAGISKGAFYYHFKSKNSLYESVITTYIEPLFPTEELSTAMNKLSLQETFNFLIDSYRSSLEDLKEVVQYGNANFYSLFFEAFQEIPDFKNKVQEFYTNLKGFITGKLLKEKNLSKSEAEKSAINHIARLEGIIFWTAIFPEYDGRGLLSL